MYTSMSELSRMTIAAFFMGIAFGALYDVFRISRVFIGVEYKGAAKRSADFLYSKKYPLIGYIKRKDGKIKKGLLFLAVGIGDIIYSIIVGAVLCVFFYYANDGIFRIQGIVASFVGFILYYKTVGSIVICFAEIICTFLKIFSKILIFTIAIPFRVLYNISIHILMKLFALILGPVLRRIVVVRSGRLKKKIMREAEHGLLLDFVKGKAFEDAA